MSDILKALNNSHIIPPSVSFEYAKRCSSYLRIPVTESIGRQIIINVLDNIDKIQDEASREIWADTVEAAGLLSISRKRKS